MSFRKNLIYGAACAALCVGRSWASGLSDAADADWLPAAQDIATHPSVAAGVSMVSMPSSAYGVLTCLGLVAWLGRSRHRRWITLR